MEVDQYRGDRVAAGLKISATLKNSERIKQAGILNASRAAERLNQYLTTNRPNLILLGEYKSAKEPIDFSCSIHNHVFQARPNDIRNGQYGCSFCTTEGRKSNNASKNPKVITKAKTTRAMMSEEDRSKLIQKTTQSRIQASVAHLDDIRRVQYFSRDFMHDMHVTQRKNINEMSSYFDVKRDVIFGQLARLDIEVVGHHISQGENELASFVEGLGVLVERSNRQIVHPKELDIYLPGYNIAIEYHGCFWHSEKYHGPEYHANKLKVCDEKGIRLIQIWEDDWNHRRHVVENFVRYVLQKGVRRINARQCNIRNIDQEAYSVFLDANHMQGGHKTASTRLGLFYGLELVAAMGFKPVAKNVALYGPGVGYELVRFASLGVRGGFMKLLSHFKNHISLDYIISFADLEIVNRNSNVYNKNGFSEFGDVKIDYSYYNQPMKRREHKFKWRKKTFADLGIDITNKTESVLANEYGLLRCWDSGKVCYILK